MIWNQGVNEETEKKAVDKEGDAVMVVWKVNLRIWMMEFVMLLMVLVITVNDHDIQGGDDEVGDNECECFRRRSTRTRRAATTTGTPVSLASTSLQNLRWAISSWWTWQSPSLSSRSQSKWWYSPQPTEEPVSPSPRIGREVWSTDHEGSQIRWQ